MTLDEVRAALEAAAVDPDYFVGEAYDIVDRLEALPNKLEITEVMLRFIETHQGVDFGAPGPLVHFMEDRSNGGYEQKLIESLGRRPTGETAGMMHRILNGTGDPDLRRRYITILLEARRHPMADADAIARIDDILEQHPAGSV